MKKFMFSVMAVAITFMAWAFTQPKEKTETGPKLDPIWYYWDGVGDKDAQASYSPAGSPLDCEGNSVLCAILADPDGTNPGRPSQADVDFAYDESDEFENEVPGLVEFHTP